MLLSITIYHHYYHHNIITIVYHHISSMLLSITIHHHYCLSPYIISAIIYYHISSMLLSITIYHHYCLSPYIITIVYHHISSMLLSITIYHHYCLSHISSMLLSITIYYHYCLSPYINHYCLSPYIIYATVYHHISSLLTIHHISSILLSFHHISIILSIHHISSILLSIHHISILLSIHLTLCLQWWQSQWLSISPSVFNRPLCLQWWQSHRPVYDSTDLSVYNGGNDIGPSMIQQTSLSTMVATTSAHLWFNRPLCLQWWQRHRPVYDSTELSVYNGGKDIGPSMIQQTSLSTMVAKTSAHLWFNRPLCLQWWQRHRPIYDSTDLSVYNGGKDIGPSMIQQISLSTMVTKTSANLWFNRPVYNGGSRQPVYDSTDLSTMEAKSSASLWFNRPVYNGGKVVSQSMILASRWPYWLTRCTTPTAN